jgi:hypothetical protein
MTLTDQVARASMALPYVLGTIKARCLVRTVGRRTHIHLSVRYWRPSRINIGARCEIRNGSYLIPEFT